MNTVLIIISVTGNVIPSVGECSPLTGFERLELSTEELALRKARGWGVSRISVLHHFHCSRWHSQYLFWAPEAEGDVFIVTIFPQSIFS